MTDGMIKHCMAKGSLSDCLNCLVHLPILHNKLLSNKVTRPSLMEGFSGNG